MPNAIITLSEHAIRLVAETFRALGDGGRLKLIVSIGESEKTVSQLVEATGLSQANASKHLQKLTQAGILNRRKAGGNVIYALGDAPAVLKLISDASDNLHKHLESQAKAFDG